VNLAELFADIPYAVVGGIATRSYMPERVTKDIDVLVPPSSYDPAVERLGQMGWKIERALRFVDSSLGRHGTSWSKGNDQQIDLITGDEDWAVEACSLPTFDAFGNRVIALPYLILMKLDAARPQDTADITRMLALADETTVQQARDVVRRYARDGEAVHDFDSLLKIGSWELESEP